MGSTDQKHYAMPRRELLDLLDTTRSDNVPRPRVRTPVERRVSRRRPVLPADAPQHITGSVPDSRS